MLDSFSRDFALLIAALAGAAITLFTTLLTLSAERRAEVRAAHRASFGKLLNEVGEAIHETIALSNVALKTSGRDSYGKWHGKAENAANRLKDLRRQVRYPLWGLDNGLRALARLPDWLDHARNDPQRAEKILKKAERLGSVLDRAIRRSYLRGEPPGLLARTAVKIFAGGFRKSFSETGPED